MEPIDEKEKEFRLGRSRDLAGKDIADALNAAADPTTNRDFTGTAGTLNELHYHLARNHGYLEETLFKAAYLLKIRKLREAREEYVRAKSILTDVILPHCLFEAPDAQTESREAGTQESDESNHA